MRLRALDSLRGIGSLIVAANHLTYTPLLAAAAPGSLAGAFFYSRWLRLADPVLDFFFLISGFAMAMVYGTRLETKRQALNFMVKRVGRIWPLHALMLMLLVGLESARAVFTMYGLKHPGVEPFTGSTSVESIFTNLLLVQSLGPEKALTWNFPAWTLSTEVAAYVILAAMAMLVKQAWRLPAALFLVGFGAAMFYHQSGGWADHDLISLSRTVTGFYLGYALYYAWRRWPIKTRLTGTVAEVAAVLGVAAVLVFTVPGVLYPLSYVAFGLMLYAFACEKGWVSEVLKGEALVWVGERSYSIYIAHFVLLEFMTLTIAGLEKLSRMNTPAWAPIGQGRLTLSFATPFAAEMMLFTFFGAVLLSSMVLYRWVETPTRDYFAALADRKFGNTRAAEGVKKPHGVKFKPSRSGAHPGRF